MQVSHPVPCDLLLVFTADFHSEAAYRSRNVSDPRFSEDLPKPARQAESSHPSGLLRLFIQRVSVRDKERSLQTGEGE